ncbi:DUF937 domain-containing protein [Erythrobacter sp. SCSIO 43205]|uniref:DUF937 domain-containing protein n=1 Tax=Erythrobacter sp. SCSIO 43205 TaxID=2779361 RepID=UPI001CA8C5D0|nr:DUF937 domain-containing protein [Erythrobacter sp. SCSIO 43205]UAB79410.1 DUF937 domain-containing protein [Erythrobacter sp. SCSIO 43205]
MSLAAMLQQTGAISSMARELGIDERTAQTAAGALLPAIVAGMGRSATGGNSTPDPLGGLGGLAGALLGGSSAQGGAAGGLGGLIGGGLLDAVLGSAPTPTQPGNDILGNIFGTKDVSRSVAGEVAGITGIDEGLLKKMLPILAMAVAGYMAKQASAGGGQQQSGGGLGGILGSIVGGMMQR